MNPPFGPHLWPHTHAVQEHPPGPLAGPERPWLCRSPSACLGLRSCEAHKLTQFLEAYVPLPSALNVGEWRIALTDYHDTTLVDHIQLGFPSN